jgi:hypothetical protein
MRELLGTPKRVLFAAQRVEGSTVANWQLFWGSGRT